MENVKKRDSVALIGPNKGGWWPQGHGIGYADSFVIEVAEFIRSISSDAEFSPDFEDGVR